MENVRVLQYGTEKTRPQSARESYLITLLVISRLPEQVLPVVDLGLQAADPVEEGSEVGDAVRLRGELEARIIEQVRQFIDALGRVLRFLPKLGGGALIFIRNLDRFIECIGDRLEQLRIFLLGLLGGEQSDLRQRSTKNLAAVGDDMGAWKFQPAFGKRLHGDVRGNGGVAIAGRERGDGVWMAEADGEMVELMRIVPYFLSRHFQHHRIERNAHRGNSDAVLLGEIGDGLNVRLDG